MKLIRRIAWIAVCFTYFLVALGGTVRTTDSGLSCPDWPLCYGQAYVALDYHTFLEQFHRYVAGSGASLACTGWPLCTAQSWAVTNHLADINVLHRIFATIVGLVLIWTLVAAWRRRKVAPGQAWVAVVAGILFVAQSIVGGL